MKIADILFEARESTDTDIIVRLISTGVVKIPLNPETQMPVPSHPAAWKDFFEGEDDYGVNLDAVDWGRIHRDFYA